MLLNNYEEKGLFFNSSFLEATSDASLQAYRGELIIIEGAIADDAGRRKAPVMLLRDAILLGDETSLKMVVGGLDSIADITTFLERYRSDFADDAVVFLLAPNAHTEAKVDLDGVTAYIQPWDAMVWKQFTEELRLEKGDFKGQSAANKVLTTYKKMAGYAPSCPQIPLEDMLANATSATKETHGAI